MSLVGDQAREIEQLTRERDDIAISYDVLYRAMEELEALGRRLEGFDTSYALLARDVVNKALGKE